MLNKNMIFTSLADDFEIAVKAYRKASSESENPSNLFLSEEEEERIYKEYKQRIKSLTTSKDYISLTRVEFWQEILKSKIQVIACIGGFEFMQDFMDYLLAQSSNDLNSASAFDFYADGISGWCR